MFATPTAAGQAKSPPARPDLLGTDKAARTAMRVFAAVAQAWELTEAERLALLGVSRTTYFRLMRPDAASPLDKAVLERLSYLFRIYEALQLLIPVPKVADRWVRQPNDAPLFAGSSALAYMQRGLVGDLKDVADYLDAQRGGDFS